MAARCLGENPHLLAELLPTTKRGLGPGQRSHFTTSSRSLSFSTRQLLSPLHSLSVIDNLSYHLPSESLSIRIPQRGRSEMGRIRSTHSSMPLSGSLGDRDRAASGVRFACWSTLYHSQPVKGLNRTRRSAYSGGLVRSGLLSMPSLWSEKASVLDYLHWDRNMLLCR